MRYAVAAIGVGAGSTTLPSFSIYSSASKGFWLRELRVANTTTTAARYKLARVSTRGTPGAAITEGEFNAAGTDNEFEAFAAHSVGPTIGTDLAVISLGAAAGSSVLLTFDRPYDPTGAAEEKGIYVPPGTANGLAVVVAAGTGQVLDICAVVDAA